MRGALAERPTHGAFIRAVLPREKMLYDHRQPLVRTCAQT